MSQNQKADVRKRSVKASRHASKSLEEDRASWAEMGVFESRLGSISKQAGIFFVERVFFQFLGVFIGIVLARILGPTLLGRYYLGLATVLVLSVFARMGFDQGLVRFIPIFNLEDRGKTKKLIKDNVLISLAVSIGFGILLYVFSSSVAINIFHSSEISYVLKIFSFYLPIFTLYLLGASILRGFKRADIQSHSYNIVSPMAFILFIMFYSLFDDRLLLIIISHILSLFVSILIVIYYLVRYQFELFHIKSVSYRYKEYLSFTFPLLLIGMIHYIMQSMDVLMLGYFVSSEEVGVYSIAVRIAILSTFGLEAVNTIFAPNISELHQMGDKKNLEKLLKTLTKWIFYLALFVFTYIAVFRTEILAVFGSSFTRGKVALIVLASGHLVNAFTGPTGTLLIMAGKQKWEVMNSVGVMTLNFVLNLILIPRFGIKGAAIATALSVGMINSLKLLEVYFEFGFHPYSFRYFKGVVAIIGGGGLAFLLSGMVKGALLLELVLGGLVLLAVASNVYYLFGLDEEDIFVLQRVRAKLRPM